MSEVVILLSVPGLRASDLAAMPLLRGLAEKGGQAALVPSFPAVTWPVEANMLTGCLAHDHGVIANGFYWRERQQVEMWTAGNDKIKRPQIWDRLHQHDPALTSAVWFPMLSKGCGADYICMPAPVHNPDGSESLWCYTKPTELYGELRDAHGHFPLQNFWGPLANIKSTEWIATTAADAAARFKPRFFYVYLPHLDYAAQKFGPDSAEAMAAVADLDVVLGKLIDETNGAYGEPPLWLVASEYAIVPVQHVSYPNRVLREAGLLLVRPEKESQDKASLGLQAGMIGQSTDIEKLKAAAIVFEDAVDFDNAIRCWERIMQLRSVDLRSRDDEAVRAIGHLTVQKTIHRGGHEDKHCTEVIDFQRSQAWTLVDHQFSHVFVPYSDKAIIDDVVQLFRGREGFAEVLAGEERARYGLDHERSGDVVLISTADSWQAYYYWLDDHCAPSFARTVDIHRKPGYDPVELFFDPATRGIPLNAELVRGSHGAEPAVTPEQQGVLVSSRPGVLDGKALRDIDVAGLVLKQFGI